MADLGKKPLLAVVVVLPGLLCAFANRAQTPAPRECEVASIRPTNAERPRIFTNPFVFAPGGRFTATNVTIADLVRMTYRTNRIRLEGGPSSGLVYK